MPKCQRVLRAYVLTCQLALSAYVLTCKHVLCAYVLTCQRALRAYVLTCQSALRALRAYVSTCSRAVTANKKNKFSILCFPFIFVIALSFFLLWNKTYIFLHCSYQAEAFNGCYDRLCTIKWFDFCLSITLRVIFKVLIKGEKWIIMCES